MGDIQIICSVPARPFPTKPGEFLNSLTVATTVYEVSSNGGKKSVPSETHATGVMQGFGPVPTGVRASCSTSTYRFAEQQGKPRLDARQDAGCNATGPAFRSNSERFSRKSSTVHLPAPTRTIPGGVSSDGWDTGPRNRNRATAGSVQRSLLAAGSSSCLASSPRLKQPIDPPCAAAGPSEFAFAISANQLPV